MEYGLSEDIILKISRILAQYPIEKAILYGSRAKGNFNASSDIDLALKGSDINLQLLSFIAINLDDLLLPYKFDLSVYSHISNIDLKNHIDRIGKILWDVNQTNKFHA